MSANVNTCLLILFHYSEDDISHYTMYLEDIISHYTMYLEDIISHYTKYLEDIISHYTKYLEQGSRQPKKRSSKNFGRNG